MIRKPVYKISCVTIDRDGVVFPATDILAGLIGPERSDWHPMAQLRANSNSPLRCDGGLAVTGEAS